MASLPVTILHVWSGKYKKDIATRIAKKNKFDRTELLEDMFQYLKQVLLLSVRTRGKRSLNLN